MRFSVRRLNPGEGYQTTTGKEEAVFVVLGGKCIADWGEGPSSIGKRKNVFDGFPYALYLPAGSRGNFRGETVFEFAERSVPSQARLAPKLLTPVDVVSSLRGGGTASRHIVDLIRPEFRAAELVAV